MNGVVLPFMPGRQNCRLARNISINAFSFNIALCEVYPYLQRYRHDGQHHSNYPFVAKISVTFVSLRLVQVLGLLCISMLPLLCIVIVCHCKFYENT